MCITSLFLRDAFGGAVYNTCKVNENLLLHSETKNLRDSFHKFDKQLVIFWVKVASSYELNVKVTYNFS